MEKTLKKNWGIYVLEVGIAGALALIDIKLFLVYFFFVVVWKIDANVDFLRKVNRGFAVINAARMQTVIKKLKVSQKEVEQEFNKAMKKINRKERKQLQEDMRDVGF